MFPVMSGERIQIKFYYLCTDRIKRRTVRIIANRNTIKAGCHLNHAGPTLGDIGKTLARHGDFDT
ncbi:MAG: hypothetical protein AAFR20_01695 [Pseudomonadota bacterium]